MPAWAGTEATMKPISAEIGFLNVVFEGTLSANEGILSSIDGMIPFIEAMFLPNDAMSSSIEGITPPIDAKTSRIEVKSPYRCKVQPELSERNCGKYS